jgi:hypothetical protein
MQDLSLAIETTKQNRGVFTPSDVGRDLAFSVTYKGKDFPADRIVSEPKGRP